MYCPNCGNEISDKASVCVSCGCSIGRIRNAASDSKASIGWWFLGFFIPIAGFLIWGLCTDSPKKAKRAGIGAIVGVITSVVLAVLFYVLYFALIFWLASSDYGVPAYSVGII